MEFNTPHGKKINTNILLAGALREYRSKYQLAQEEMSRHFSVSLSTYRNWESGRSKPTRINEKKIRDLISDKYKNSGLVNLRAIS
jgi:DNA-binding transcriptional regulator YiaG|tara:strand:- start:370 stop:624 length:255 start_codon:yes stop_codon:yes gene_type:complete